MALTEYPKWLHAAGKTSVLVDNAEAEKAELAKWAVENEPSGTPDALDPNPLLSSLADQSKPHGSEDNTGGVHVDVPSDAAAPGLPIPNEDSDEPRDGQVDAGDQEDGKVDKTEHDQGGAIADDSKPAERASVKRGPGRPRNS